MLRQGVICYEHVNSWGKYNHKSLPPNEKFFNEVNNEKIKNTDMSSKYGVSLTSKIWDSIKICITIDVLFLDLA